MKKLLFLLLIAVTTSDFSAFAQPGQTKSQTMIVRNNAGTVKAADTLTNTDNGTNGYRVGYEYDISVDATIRVLTGYGRGTMKLQGTMDSTNGPWYTLRSDRAVCFGCTDSTYTIYNAATQYARWNIPKINFTYVRLYNATDTTETVKITSQLNYGYQ